MDHLTDLPRKVQLAVLATQAALAAGRSHTKSTALDIFSEKKGAGGYERKHAQHVFFGTGNMGHRVAATFGKTLRHTVPKHDQYWGR